MPAAVVCAPTLPSPSPVCDLRVTPGAQEHPPRIVKSASLLLHSLLSRTILVPFKKKMQNFNPWMSQDECVCNFFSYLIAIKDFFYVCYVSLSTLTLKRKLSKKLLWWAFIVGGSLMIGRIQWGYRQCKYQTTVWHLTNYLAMNHVITFMMAESQYKVI